MYLTGTKTSAWIYVVVQSQDKSTTITFEVSLPSPHMHKMITGQQWHNITRQHNCHTMEVAANNDIKITERTTAVATEWEESWA